MLHGGAKVEGAGHLHAGGFAGGDPRGGEHGAESGSGGGGDLPRGDGEVFDADEDVERADGFADGADEEAGQGEGGEDAEEDAGEAEDEGFAEEEKTDFAARGADGAEDADLAPGAHDGGGDGVVDEKHADEERDEAEGGEVELEAGEHFPDLLAALLRRGDEDIGGHEVPGGVRHGGRVGPGREQHGHGVKLSDGAEEFLRPSDIHRRGADVGEGGGVVGFEDEADAHFGGASVGYHAKGVAGLEIELLREGAGHGDGVAFAQPDFNVDGRAVGPDHAEGLERRVGERIDAEDAEIFAGVVGEGEESLDNGGGGGDAGDFRQSGKQGFVEGSAHFEIGLAGEEFDAGAERAVRAVVGDHDGEENADAEGHAGDVERGEELVPTVMAQHLPEKDGRPVARHFSARWAATAASWRTRWSWRISRSSEILVPSSARER